MTDRPSMPARCGLLAAMFLPAALAGCSAPGAAALRTPPPYRLFDVDRGLSCAAAAASFRFAVVRAARLEDWLAAGPLPSYGLDRFGTDGPAQLEDERGRLEATIAAQTTLVTTLQERVDMRQALLATASESRAKVIDALELMQTQAATLASERGQLGELDASLDRIAHEVDKAQTSFAAENAQKLADAERAIDEDGEKLAKARVKTANMVLRSPIDGTVSGLAVTSVGQVVTVGEQIMQIVPQNARLEIECYLPNGDVGFIHADQPAIVKVDSFPFTDYGTLDATVTRVARDAIPQPDADTREGNPASPGKEPMFAGAQRVQNLVFPATLSMSRTSMVSDDAEVPLMPGMAVTVEIKTGTRRIISYVFSPLIQVARTAFRER